jgi:hypothetical protein
VNSNAPEVGNGNGHDDDHIDPSPEAIFAMVQTCTARVELLREQVERLESRLEKVDQIHEALVRLSEMTTALFQAHLAAKDPTKTG